jgi:enoyl-CoA hydratase/carnithine racemase
MLFAERRGGVLVATLARAPVNALDAELLARIDAVITDAEVDDSVSVLHIRSAHEVFCAGADLALMRECIARPSGAEAMVAVVQTMQRVFARLEAAPFVALAEIAGAAVGGGLELVLACDLRVAALDARFAFPEVSLGLVPAAGGTQRLTAVCGPAIARRLILGGEVVDGAAAERIGLVQWAQPADALALWTAALAARLAAHPRAALAAGKHCIALAAAGSKDGFAAEIAATRERYADPQTLQRVGAFLARDARAAVQSNPSPDPGTRSVS